MISNTRPILDPGTHTGTIWDVKYSPNGHLIATASNDNTIRVWDRWSLMPIRVLREGDDSVNGQFTTVGFSPDGNYLAGGRIDGSILIFESVSWRLIKKLNLPPLTTVNTLAFSSDGRYLASGGYNGEIYIWDMYERRLHKTLRAHYRGISSLKFIPHSHTLVSASYDATIKIWDVSYGKLITTLYGHQNAVRCLAVSESGLIISGSYDNTIKIWRGSKKLKTLKAKNNVMAIDLVPNDKLIVATYNDWEITLWDLNRGKLVKTLGKHSNLVAALAVSPDGVEAISAGGNRREIRKWDLTSGKQIWEIASPGDCVYKVAFAKNGSAVGFGYKGKIEHAFNFNTLNIVRAKDSEFLKEKKFGRGMKLVITKTQDYPHERLFAKTWGKLKPIAVHDLDYWDKVLDATFTPDENFIAVGTWFGAFLYDTNGRRIRQFPGNLYDIFSVSVSPNGLLLAVSSSDQTVKIFNLRTGVLLVTIFYGVHEGEWVAFTPKGYYVSSRNGSKYLKWVDNKGAFFNLSGNLYWNYHSPNYLKNTILTGKIL